jgi:hypothetical protein
MQTFWAEKKMARDGDSDEKSRSFSLYDFNSSETVEVICPTEFELETVLIDTAFYKYRGREYRFLLCRARELGLKIA